jgi:signal transduction histidine kinase/HAMP domain-containing protein
MMWRTFLNGLYRRLHLNSLRKKLLTPIAVVMLISLLGSAVAFLIGTTLTQRRLLEQQVNLEAERVSKALVERVEDVQQSAVLLANDPEVQRALLASSQDDALMSLHGRAVAIHERLGMDMIQVYNRQNEPRVNLLDASLCRESLLLEETQAGTPVVRTISGHVLLLGRADLPDGDGVVITGIDLAPELARLVSRFRLSADLGLRAEDTEVSNSIEFPFEAVSGRHDDLYSESFFLTLGSTPVTLLLARPVTDMQQVSNTGLLVMVVSTVMTTVLLVGVNVASTRAIEKPIHRLSEAAELVAEGDLQTSVHTENLPSLLGIGDNDEIGLLADVFNDMLRQLRRLYDHLESEVAARTHELATTADVAQAVSSSLDLDVVMRMAAHLIHIRFDFCHLEIFTVDPPGDCAVLRESIGESGQPPRRQRITIARRASTLVGSAAITRSACVVQDTLEDTRYDASAWLERTRSAVAVPMLIGRTVVGVLAAESQEPGTFTPEVVSLLTTLANQIAMGIKNAQLYRSEQRRRRFAEHLELAGRVLTSSLEMKEVPGRVLSLLEAVVAYERGSVWLRQEEELVPLAVSGFSDLECKRLGPVPVRSGDVFHQLMADKEPLILDDVTHEPGWVQLPWLPVHRSWLGAPIISKGDVIGMISLTRAEAGAFTVEEAEWVQSFALQAGIALENAQLYAEIAQFNATLEKRVEQRTEELNRAYQTLEQLDVTKSDFIDVTAHELRTPLTVIKAYAQMLQNFLADDPRPMIDRSVGGILKGADRLCKIVNSMLDVAKIESQAMKVTKEQISLGDVVDHVHANLTVALDERRLTFQTSGLDDLPWIEVDAELLRKMFEHVVTNAIKYTPDGGSITVTGREGLSEAGQRYVEIVVRDTGIGIDPAQQEVIFEKFYQMGEGDLHSSGQTKFKGGGPGLGLAIARGIVQAHGGRIWVESEGYDEAACPGTEVYVRLPWKLRPAMTVEKESQSLQQVQAPVV